MSEVAECAGISGSSATQCLRALNAKRLLNAGLISRWVRYRVGHDPTVHGTRELVQALRRQLRSSGDAIDRTFVDITAFTHPRRAIIVHVLTGDNGLSFARLMTITGISAPALSRHLEKLQHRGVVEIRKQDYFCRRPRTPVLKTLVRLASA